MDNTQLLEIKSLKVSIPDLYLVQDLSFELKRGETLAIVGESGSGKSLTSLAIMGLLASNLKVEGSICFNGRELTETSEAEYQNIRGKQIGMIFQEPMTALNPSMKCGLQLTETLQKHEGTDFKTNKRKAIELFEKVKLPQPAGIFNSYPHQISGGQKQRVMIAMAIACKPDLLIADEPTTALDVTVQSEILKLLKSLQQEYGMGMLFISHDLGVVKEVADKVLVMYKGALKEYKSTQQLFDNPESDYTQGLLACRPTAHSDYKRLPLVADFLSGKNTRRERVSSVDKLEKAKKILQQKPLLEIRDLKRWFGASATLFSSSKRVVKAVDEVSFEIYPGETLGLVGESGCGKTTLGRILSGLEKADEGEILYEGKDISSLSRTQWRRLHREIQIIFQDPFSSLNPRLTIGSALQEVLKVHRKAQGKSAEEKVKELLIKVGLEAEHYNRYPHEFSGGQRQRIGIARALALEPRFIVCDESVSALDVSVQAQIINLLNDLKDDFRFTYLFISHDLSVVKYFSDRILVMQSGKLVESGYSDEVYTKPQEAYTKRLVNSVSS